VGVAAAGADFIKFGLAEQSPEAAIYLAANIVRSVRKLVPQRKKLYPAVFVDEDMSRFFDPLRDATRLVRESGADGLLVDTFNKAIGKGLLDYWSLADVRRFVRAMHSLKKEAWIAGSITKDELPSLWSTGVDVICVRGAACEPAKGSGRFGHVTTAIVRELIATMPSNRRR
jgi:hypothetical protein